MNVNVHINIPIHYTEFSLVNRRMVIRYEHIIYKRDK